MSEKLNIETTPEKEDISHIPNSMFDQNVSSFTEGETMNRDYLYQIYGESMDFMNKEVRLTRTKYYESREKVEKEFAENTQHEKKKLIVFTVFFIVLVIFAVISFCISDGSFDAYHELYQMSFNEYVDKKYARAYWAQGGLFFGIGWIVLIIGTSVFGVFVYSTIKNIKHCKAKRERALKVLEENKHEQMLLGFYDAGR